MGACMATAPMQRERAHARMRGSRCTRMPRLHSAFAPALNRLTAQELEGYASAKQKVCSSCSSHAMQRMRTGACTCTAAFLPEPHPAFMQAPTPASNALATPV